ncbi:MAG: hypothetical protein U0354_01260 [Candidatus Sericytochromatia bacterium]
MNKLKLRSNYIHDNLLSICAWCGAIRDTHDIWHRINYIKFKCYKPSITHGICPECINKLDILL